MVIFDAFTHYVALNPVPHCNAYYAYTTLYEHWIAKFGLPEIVVTDTGTEFINKEIITLRIRNYHTPLYATYTTSNINHVHLMHLGQTV